MQMGMASDLAGAFAKGLWSGLRMDGFSGVAACRGGNGAGGQRGRDGGGSWRV